LRLRLNTLEKKNDSGGPRVPVGSHLNLPPSPLRDFDCTTIYQFYVCIM
jgi:hypothetical protein